MPVLGVLYPGICFTTEEKSTEETSVKVAGLNSVCRHGRLLRVARISRSRTPCFRGRGLTLFQRRYLPSCVTKGLPTSGNSESSL